MVTGEDDSVIKLIEIDTGNIRVSKINIFILLTIVNVKNLNNNCLMYNPLDEIRFQFQLNNTINDYIYTNFSKIFKLKTMKIYK